MSSHDDEFSDLSLDYTIKKNGHLIPTAVRFSSGPWLEYQCHFIKTFCTSWTCNKWWSQVITTLKSLWEVQSLRVKFPTPMILDVILRIYKNTNKKAAWFFFRMVGTAKYMIQTSAGTVKCGVPGGFSHTETRRGMLDQWHVLIWGLFQMTSKWAGDYERAIMLIPINGIGRTREESH